jgi:hypothetical protein
MIPNSDTAGPFQGSPSRARHVHRQIHIFIFTWGYPQSSFAIHRIGGSSTNGASGSDSVRAGVRGESPQGHQFR